MDTTEILRKPFDIKTHKKYFINYLEVVISEDGVVMYAVPSHQEKLIQLACKKLNITRNELNDLCPKEFYFDFNRWLCIVSGCVSLWNNFMLGAANEAQADTIKTLIEAGLYSGTIILKNGGTNNE